MNWFGNIEFVNTYSPHFLSNPCKIKMTLYEEEIVHEYITF